MDFLNDMKQQMSALGLYTLDSSTIVYAELSAYASALNLLEDYIKELEREAFILTAESWGITEREKFFKSIAIFEDLETRRKSLIARKAISDNDFTVKGIERVFMALGMKCQIIETPTESYTAVIESLPDELRNEEVLLKICDLYLPSHLILNTYIV